MSASYTLRGFAQDARGAINDVLDSFTLPVFGGFMLGGIILGLIQQWDNIIDKENRGTRKEGFVALGWYVGFALLAAVVVSAVKSAISGISLSIFRRRGMESLPHAGIHLPGRQYDGDGGLRTREGRRSDRHQ